MIEQLVNIDERIFLFLNSLNSIYLDPFMYGFSSRFVWIPFYLTIAIIMLWRFGWKKGLILLLATALAVGCSDFICASVIRPFFARLRPANLENPISALVHIVNEYRSGRYGFPSCHAANTFALATATSFIFKNRSYFIFIFFWALLQCFSRIYLGVHYPGDIAVGALIGFAMGYCGYYISAKSSLQPANGNVPIWPIIVAGCLTTIAIIIIF